MFGLFKKKHKKKKAKAYVSPEMPPFPMNYDGVVRLLAPYHKQGRPLDFFFEMYIVSVIDELPEESLFAFAASSRMNAG